jgi:predicted nucleic acid-binding Zn ribbon protein
MGYRDDLKTHRRDDLGERLSKDESFQEMIRELGKPMEMNNAVGEKIQEKIEQKKYNKTMQWISISALIVAAVSMVFSLIAILK